MALNESTFGSQNARMQNIENDFGKLIGIKYEQMGYFST